MRSFTPKRWRICRISRNLMNPKSDKASNPPRIIRPDTKDIPFPHISLTSTPNYTTHQITQCPFLSLTMTITRRAFKIRNGQIILQFKAKHKPRDGLFPIHGRPTVSWLFMSFETLQSFNIFLEREREREGCVRISNG